MSPSTRSVVLSGWRRIPGPPRDHVKARLLRLHASLVRRLGRPDPWSGATPYEIAVGVILAHGRASTVAAPAVAALRARRLLEPRRLLAIGDSALGRVLRSAGADGHEAERLRAFTRWLVTRFDGRFDGPRRVALAPLRAELLRIPALGPETADAILLHAAHRPVVVADACARRALVRHRLMPAGTGYEAARTFLEAHLPSDPALFGELHALLAAAGTKAGSRGPRLTPLPARRRSGRRRRARPASPRAVPSA